MKKTETRWIIIYPHGLFVGQWQSRIDAITEHCNTIYGTTRFSDGRRLPEDTKQQWENAKRYQGKRAVKATITYEVPDES